MQRRIKYGAFLVLFLTAGLSIYGFLFHAVPRSKMAAKPDVRINAGDLAMSFDNNRDLSDSLYLYKVLSVSGIIKKIRKNKSGNYTISLGNRRSATPSISCILDSSYDHRYISFMTGDSLTISGTCAGHLTDVFLIQCIVEKK